MKKKSTLLLVLLTMVCVVCATFGLAACKDDNGGGEGGEPTKTVVKVGETDIGTVTSEGSTFDVEGEFNKEYVVTVKSGDTVCDSVLIQIPDVAAYGQGSYGTFTFVCGKDYKIKFSSATTVENVKVTMAEKTYPAGSLRNPNAVTVGTDVTYSVGGWDYVWYSISVSEAGNYEITFTGEDADKVFVVYGDTIDTDGYQMLADPYSEGETIFTFTANKTYYIGIVSDAMDDNGGYATLTGTLKVEAYTAPVFPTLSADKLTVSLGTIEAGMDNRVTVKVNTEDGKTYTVTASSAEIKFVKMGNPVDGPEVFDGKDCVNDDNVATLVVMAENTVENVTLTLSITETQEVVYPYTTVTVGTPVNDTVLSSEDTCIYQITLTAGTYKVTGDISLTGDWGADIVIGSTITGYEEESPETAQVEDTLDIDATTGEFTVTEDGKYFIIVYATDTFTISEVVNG